MSIEITVEIPLDLAAAIRDINYDLERVDGDVEFTLATVTNDIIQAVKALPHESIPRKVSHFCSTSRGTGKTSDSSGWRALRSCSGTSSSSDDSLLGTHMFPEFVLVIENEYGYSHRTQATGDMTIADLEAMLGPVCGFEPTWQSLTWHNYRVNQPHATLCSYGIDRYPFLEIKRRSPPAFDDQTVAMLKEPRLPPRAVVTSPPLPPRLRECPEEQQKDWTLGPTQLQAVCKDWDFHSRTGSGPWDFR